MQKLIRRKVMEDWIKCPDCDGEGVADFEVPMPHSPSRDIGELYIEEGTCETCGGLGQIDPLGDYQ